MIGRLARFRGFAPILALLLATSLGACVREGAEGEVGLAGDDGAPGVDGAQGEPGTDGSSCTVVDNGDGTATITCTDGTTVTIRDGVDGVDGVDGDDGIVAQCTVDDNHDGTATITCTDGSTVTVGIESDSSANEGFRVADLHGQAVVLSTGQFETNNKEFVDVTIVSAAADAAGVVTVDFTVEDEDGDPIINLASLSAGIAKLVPGAGGTASEWQSYIYRTQTVSGSSFPMPNGTQAAQANMQSSSSGTLVNHGDGSYTYTFGGNIASVVRPVDLTPITYDRSLTHRAYITIGGSSGPTGDAHFDFVPDGTALTDTRDIVQTESCYACHGEKDFRAHGGNRLSVEGCVVCHNPGTSDPHSGNTVDLKVMIHKIHAGGELMSIPGADGIVWDNPATVVDESADNGEYAIYGYGNTPHSWEKAAFPAVIENCEKCHQGAGVDVDAWKTVPTRDACGSCHDTIDWTSGVGHDQNGAPGAQGSDAGCAFCHGPTASKPVSEAHDWMTKWITDDPRKIPEFSVELTLSTPANGTHFVAGEAPVVYLKLTDAETDLLIDHTTIAADGAAEDCLEPPGACDPRDGLFRTAALFVHGPRAERRPVLATAARAQILSPSAPASWDLSAASASLILKVDGGLTVPRPDSEYGAGGYADTFPGTITVLVTCGGSIGRTCSLVDAETPFVFGNTAAATVTEIVDWLNGNADFAGRAIAWDEGGKVGIRSRGKGNIVSVQLQTSAVATAVFGGDTAVKLPGGFTPSNNLITDPRSTKTTGHVAYQLDPVDDLEPGTYIASVEIADRGNKSETNYRTPSVAKVTFNVGQATTEKLVAGGCASCHQGPNGTGYILDFRRHYKIFDDTAIDQCAACHDTQPQSSTGLAFSGAKPISKRVHAIHFGAELNYPLTTVDYSNGDPVPGRAWEIHFPQDIRNCETCHDSTTTSGTWETKPDRLSCAGCHDSDAATAHIQMMTIDPTPDNAWSGDEQETCATCH